MLARIKGVEGHPGPIYYYLGEYWYVFSFLSVVALGGLITCLSAESRTAGQLYLVPAGCDGALQLCRNKAEWICSARFSFPVPS